MTEDRKHEEDAPRIVPVFPLPNTVFFPGTFLPLHIFEPRYRAMVQDASTGDGLIAIALAQGGEFHAVGTVGRIRDLEPLEDGRSNLRLEGLQRVEMTEIRCDTPYRQVRAVPRSETLSPDDPAAVEQAKLELLAILGLLRSVAGEEQVIVMHQELPFDVVVNSACAGLPVAAGLRQALLEDDDLSSRHLQLSEYLALVVDAIRELPTQPGRDETPLN